jgi:hypothetical protein
MANKNTKLAAGAAAGVLAAGAAAAAGYYFYASKGAQKNRKIAAKWAGNLKNDVVKQAKKIKDLDRAQMLAIVDQATTAYKTVRNVDQNDLARAAKELKNNWKELAAELAGGAQKIKKVAKKTAGSAQKSATKAGAKVKKAVSKARR